MMTDEQAKALGLRLVACDGFRWVPGMLAMEPDFCANRVVYINNEGALLATLYNLGHVDVVEIDVLWRNYVPDLRDAATRGCVLQSARGKHDNPHLSIAREQSAVFPPTFYWYVSDGASGWLLGDEEDPQKFDTEEEALVAAVEARL